MRYGFTAMSIGFTIASLVAMAAGIMPWFSTWMAFATIVASISGGLGDKK